MALEAIFTACALLEELLPAYSFHPRWVVVYKAGSPEQMGGKRFLALGAPRGEAVSEPVFVLSLVPPSGVRRGKVVLEPPTSEGVYTLRPA